MPKRPRSTVSIRPGVTVLSVLRHLNYKPWFALAEFVDNSIQSFLENRESIRAAEPSEPQLTVKIELNTAPPASITIRDNAAGIGEKDFPRAFRPAAVPPNTTGLSEFGMGMKSAACWFSPRWSVRTSALGEPIARKVDFDINRIVHDKIEELGVHTERAKASDHFTEIRLMEVHNVPVGRTVGKIKEHLADIYRVFIRRGDLTLRFGTDNLQYEKPEILLAPRYNSNNEPEGEPLRWRVDLDDFDFGSDLRATGFVALRKTANTRYAGLSLFRRDRLIEGSGDEKYRPREIFGDPNAYEYQRLFGELHLDGFEVSHTKDGFRWDENEEPFLELLKERLTASEMNLLAQARNYRVRATKKQAREAAKKAVDSTANSLKKHGDAALGEAAKQPVDTQNPETLTETAIAATRTFDLHFEGRPWRVVLELSDDRALSDWLELSEAVIAGENSSSKHQLLGLRMSIRHPFVERFAGVDPEKLEPIVRLAAALGLAEKAAREGGVKQAPSVRLKVNKLLEYALARR